MNCVRSQILFAIPRQTSVNYLIHASTTKHLYNTVISLKYVLNTFHGSSRRERYGVSFMAYTIWSMSYICHYNKQYLTIDHGIPMSGCINSLWPRGCFKNTYELLNLRALKFSPVNEIHIFQCMGKIVCVEFQRAPLKFHTKYLAHTLKDTIFMQHWNFKSS